MQNKSFDNLMLIGRAGSGKSELIDFLKNVDEADRRDKYHIGAFDEIDDFPWIHSLFKDEDIWEELGRPRRLSKKDDKIYATVDWEIYRFTTLKFNIEVKRRFLSQENYYNNKTLFIEYARGREDGYHTCLPLFDDQILKKTAIFYVDNTYEESMRRNTVRSHEGEEEQSILFHKVPLEVMEGYYKTNDWYNLTDKKPDGYIEVKGIKIPFVTVWNIPESHDFRVLEERYSPPLKRLWELYSKM